MKITKEGTMTIITDLGLGKSEEVDAVSLETARKLEEENRIMREALIAVKEFMPSIDSLPKIETRMGNAVHKLEEALSKISEEREK